MSIKEEKKELYKNYSEKYGYNIPLYIEFLGRLSKAKVALETLGIEEFICVEDFEAIQTDFLWQMQNSEYVKKQSIDYSDWLPLGVIKSDDKPYKLYSSILSFKLFIVLKERVFNTTKEVIIGWLGRPFLENLDNVDLMIKRSNNSQSKIQNALRCVTPEAEKKSSLLPIQEYSLFYSVTSKVLKIWVDAEFY